MTKVRVDRSDDHIDILEAFPEDDPDFVLGTITVGRERVYDAKHMNVVEGPAVLGIGVHAGNRREGAGTILWTAAAKLACTRYKAPLMSGVQRSKQAESFWKKQVTKGRASCIIRNGRKCKVYRLKSCPAPESLAGRR